MAHFAELDNLSYVKRVVVIPNEDILDSEGNESEEIGIARCEELFGGGEWIQTSYNATIRGQFAGPGFYYDKERNIFI
jgi:hypothetical protein